VKAVRWVGRVSVVGRICAKCGFWVWSKTAYRSDGRWQWWRWKRWAYMGGMRRMWRRMIRTRLTEWSRNVKVKKDICIDICIKPRLHQGNMLPATKLLPVCCPSVAGYKGIHVADCRDVQATFSMLINLLPLLNVAGQDVACCPQHVARPRNMLPSSMLPWCKRGLTR